MTAGKRTPLTGAQRQRRWRDKRRDELQALRAVVPQSAKERDLQAQVQHLQWKLQMVARDLAIAQARAANLEAAQSSAHAWQEAWRTLLPKLTTASRHVAQHHLQACGLELIPTGSTTDAPPGSTATPTTPQLIF